MKRRSAALILSAAITTMLFTGCSGSGQHQTTTGNQGTVVQTGDTYAYINPNNVEWMTMQGALRIHTKVLFSGLDDEKIKRITSIVNKGSNKRASTETEKNTINSEARPIGIKLKMKDGSIIYVWPSYKVSTLKDGWSAAPNKDRFVLNIMKDGKDEYYTLTSTQVPAYISENWKQDMPVVEELKVTKENLIPGEKLVVWDGDTVTVSGDGCTEKEVALYLQKNGNTQDKYLIAKIPVSKGRWQWSGVIGRRIKGFDGKQFILDRALYDIIAEIGSTRTGPASIIDLRESETSDWEPISKTYYTEGTVESMQTNEIGQNILVLKVIKSYHSDADPIGDPYYPFKKAELVRFVLKSMPGTELEEQSRVIVANAQIADDSEKGWVWGGEISYFVKDDKFLDLNGNETKELPFIT